MYTEEDISNAITKGIFSQESASSFRKFIAEQRGSLAVDEENFRLVSSFNDIFVAAICVLLLISAIMIGDSFVSWGGALAETIAAWTLAEIFTRNRRMALPSILLACAFVGGVFATGLLFQTAAATLAPHDLLNSTYHAVILSGLVAALSAWIHWWRFRVPITVALGVAASGITLGWLAREQFPELSQKMHLVFFLLGIAIFFLAMRWDMSDPARLTRRSDVAFWLHLLAAPLLVGPIFYFLHVIGGAGSLRVGLVVLIMYLVLAAISLSIDRRALMASALFYVIFTMTEVLREHGVVNLSLAFAGLIIGMALLILSIFWHPVRQFVLRYFPASLQSRLPKSQR